MSCLVLLLWVSLVFDVAVADAHNSITQLHHHLNIQRSQKDRHKFKSMYILYVINVYVMLYTRASILYLLQAISMTL